MFKKHIGCSRFIYNYFLAYQNKNYENGGKYVGKYDIQKLLSPLKKQEEYQFLNEVSSATLCLSIQNLDTAFKRFFKKLSRYPKFKSKHKSKASFQLRNDRMYFVSDRLIKLEKIGKVKYKSSHDLTVGNKLKFINSSISLINNKWILTFTLECENQTQELNDYSMGIDLGIKELATVSCNNSCYVYHNINKSKKVRLIEKRIKHIQRNLSKKYQKGKPQSNRYIREQRKLQRYYYKLTCIRNNYIHQITRQLVDLLPSSVIMEDLNVSGMMKNKHLAKSVQDCKLYFFIQKMKYKCNNLGIEFIQVPRFYPSSKLCSCCGNKKTNLRLSDRIYHCEVCGNTLDRDYNASINLEKYSANL